MRESASSTLQPTTLISLSNPSRGCRLTLTRTCGDEGAVAGALPARRRSFALARIRFPRTSTSAWLPWSDTSTPSSPRPPTATRSPTATGRCTTGSRAGATGASTPARRRSATSSMAAWACRRAEPASPVVSRGVAGWRVTRSASTDVRFFRSATTASISRRASRTRSSIRSVTLRRNCSSRSFRVWSRSRNSASAALIAWRSRASAALSRSSARRSSSTRAR